MKNKTLSWWKKEADKYFSQYIRQKYADKNGMVACYTCGHINHWKKMQNGHCLPRQYLATRFDEKNCRVQCYACNMLYGGQVVVFINKLCKEYGDDFRHELEKKKWVVTKFEISDYQRMIEEWKLSTSSLD